MSVWSQVKSIEFDQVDLGSTWGHFSLKWGHISLSQRLSGLPGIELELELWRHSAYRLNELVCRKFILVWDLCLWLRRAYGPIVQDRPGLCR